MLTKFIRRKIGPKKWKFVKYSFIALAVICVGVILYNSLTTPGVPKPSVETRVFTEHRLVRIPAASQVSGVLAGFAYYFSIPLWLLRIAFVLVIVFLPDDFDNLVQFLFLAYILCWIFMPTIDFIPTDFVARVGG